MYRIQPARHSFARTIAFAFHFEACLNLSLQDCRKDPATQFPRCCINSKKILLNDNIKEVQYKIRKINREIDYLKSFLDENNLVS